MADVGSWGSWAGASSSRAYRGTQRHDEAIACWHTERWPALKKLGRQSRLEKVLLAWGERGSVVRLLRIVALLIVLGVGASGCGSGGIGGGNANVSGHWFGCVQPPSTCDNTSPVNPFQATSAEKWYMELQQDNSGNISGGGHVCLYLTNAGRATEYDDLITITGTSSGSTVSLAIDYTRPVGLSGNLSAQVSSGQLIIHELSSNSSATLKLGSIEDYFCR
jgi:hypothetical protein